MPSPPGIFLNSKVSEMDSGLVNRHFSFDLKYNGTVRIGGEAEGLGRRFSLTPCPPLDHNDTSLIINIIQLYCFT